MSFICTPILIHSSAFVSNSPIRVITKFVPSPFSSFWAYAAILTKLAAG